MLKSKGVRNRKI